MKFTLPVKMLAVSTLVLGSLVGCAGQSQQAADSSAAKPAAVASAAVNQSLDAARASIKTANELKWIWRDTEDTLKKAEEAAAAGDESKAIKLANTAKAEADAAVNQYYLEKSKYLLEELKAKRNLTAKQKQARDMLAETASAAITNAEGKKAYDLLSQP